MSSVKSENTTIGLIEDVPYRGFGSYDAEQIYFWKLNSSQRRQYRLQGHAYFVSKRPENSGNTPEQNWQIAEDEFVKDRVEFRIARAVRYKLAALYNVDPSTINDKTRLPENPDARIRFCHAVTVETKLNKAVTTHRANTVDDLINQLCS